MKVWFCTLLLLGFFFKVHAQLRVILPVAHEREYAISDEISYLPAQYYSYKNAKHKPAGIWLAQTTTYTGESGATYWTGNVTSQSYGKGKWGTFYYWDVQGNLRDMKGFIDIAGKNKRGLKLVFPWR